MADAEPVWQLAPPPVVRTQDVLYGDVEIELSLTAGQCPVCGAADPAASESSRKVAWIHNEPRGLGDFIWPAMGRGEVFVSPRVATAGGIHLRPVAVAERFVDRDTGRERGTLPSRLIQTLGGYSEMVVRRVVPAVVEQSTFVFSDSEPCGACGRFAVRWRPPGPGGNQVADVEGVEWVERVSTTVTPFGIDYERVRHPYQPGAGAAFRRSDIDGAPVWRMQQDPYEILCSSPFKREIEHLGATNVDFLEVGRVIDA